MSRIDLPSVGRRKNPNTTMQNPVISDHPSTLHTLVGQTTTFSIEVLLTPDQQAISAALQLPSPSNQTL